jgi:methionine sulfoxide reductase heme-binding subunit
MDLSSLHLALRITARVSLLFFLWVFTAPAHLRLSPMPGFRRLASRSDDALLALAASHTVHLALIVALMIRMGPTVFVHMFWLAMIFGGLAYGFIYALAWTALRKTTKSPARPSRFKAFACYYVWTIFAIVYVGSALRGRFYTAFAILLVASLVIRIAWAVRSQSGCGAARQQVG